MNKNQYPTSPERQTTDPKMLQYSDGGTAFVWDKPGDVLDTSMGAIDQRLKDFGYGMNVTIVTTKSGNRYGFGRGVVINARKQQGFRAPQEIPSITIGESLDIPGVASTSDVESVAVEGKYYTDKLGHAEQRENPNPFPSLHQQLSYINRALGRPED